MSVDVAPIAGATITLVGARAGWFVTPEELELRKPQNVTDAVRHFPSILLSPVDDGKIDPVAAWITRTGCRWSGSFASRIATAAR